LTTLSLLLLVFLLLGCGVPRQEYEKVESDLAVVQMQLSQVTGELTQRNSELASLRNQYDDLQNNYDELHDEYNELFAEYTDTQLKYIDALEELGQSLQVPYTAISGREITCAWEDLGGRLHMWTWPVDTYRSWIECPKPSDKVSLNCGGTIYTMHDFVPYVRSESFSTVITDFYQECADELTFAHEVFNLVTQLIVYSEDIGEIPRWPIETLTESGGDCEDLAILFASLIKAAPYPYEVSLVYIDSDNPTDPLRPNHVIVFIETEGWKTFVECTSKQGWNYYESVVGWYYEL
jgi:hypothetical protein